jgi:hypothetical protein
MTYDSMNGMQKKSVAMDRIGIINLGGWTNFTEESGNFA